MSPTNVCTNVHTSVHMTLKLKVLISGVSRASKTFKGKVKLKTLMDWVTWGLSVCNTKGITELRIVGSYGLGIFVNRAIRVWNGKSFGEVPKLCQGGHQ